MNIKLKQKALKQLAKTEGDSAQVALDKAVDQIAAVLASETHYENINNQLELLAIIAYRVSEKAGITIRALLERLKKTELVYPSIGGSGISPFYRKDQLIEKTLKCLNSIRYYQLELILEIFLEYSNHEDDQVRKQAELGLKELAEYNFEVFYGTAEWGGLRAQPQQRLVSKLLTLDDSDLQKYFSAIIILCQNLLSPDMASTTSDYRTITLRQAAVPALEQIKNIRKSTLDILEKLYNYAASESQKKALLNALQTATRTHHGGGFGSDVLDMIATDSIQILQFFERIVPVETLPVIQIIERDALWLYSHHQEDAIESAALNVKQLLEANGEYQIYKVLVGFDGLFQEWESKQEVEEGHPNRIGANLDRVREFRERKTKEYVESISLENYEEWKNRIITYLRVASNDLDMFSYLGKFLEYFGQVSPQLALRLVKETAETTDKFFIAALYGIWKTEHRETLRQMLYAWVEIGKHLVAIARFLSFVGDFDEALLKKVFERATEQQDLYALVQILGAVTAHYNQGYSHLVEELFVPAVQMLTQFGESGWRYDFWYRPEREAILSNLQGQDIDILLDNLLLANSIDYQAEEILASLAQKNPDKVLHFFGNRLRIEREQGRSNFEAVPFGFNTLQKPLSVIPDQAVDIVASWYNDDYGIFTYRGALLLHNIFPNFPPLLENKLKELVHTKEQRNLLIVFAILKNYDGNACILDVCKEIVKVLPEGSNLLGEVKATLFSTGVVMGEYGIVDAYIQKKDEITSWLDDEDAKVRVFAEEWQTDLAKMIELERNRVKEGITLSKLEYGDLGQNDKE